MEYSTCKSKSRKYPYTQRINCCHDLSATNAESSSYTVAFYNRQLLHQTMSSSSIQAADVVIRQYGIVPET